MSLYLLDTGVLIRHLRRADPATAWLQQRLAAADDLGISAVSIAEVERGVRDRERRAVDAFLGRFRFLVTGREAAHRAGRYQREFASRGQTLDIADALIAGTARAHGAILVTANVRDFPMTDIRIEPLPT